MATENKQQPHFPDTPTTNVNNCHRLTVAPSIKQYAIGYN